MNTSRLLLAVFVIAFSQLAAGADNSAKALKKGTSGSEQGANLLFGSNSQVKPYLPSNLKYASADRSSLNCTEDGTPAGAKSGGRCTTYFDPSKGTKYVVRCTEPNGFCDRIFLVTKTNSLVLYAQFTSGDHNPVYASGEARQFAQANGVKTPETQVATSPVLAGQPKVAVAAQEGPGCAAEKNALLRFACERTAKSGQKTDMNVPVLGGIIDAAKK